MQNLIHISAHVMWERLPEDPPPERRTAYKVSRSRRGPLPRRTLCTTVQSQIRSFLVENENFGVSFFLSLHLRFPWTLNGDVQLEHSFPIFGVVICKC